MSLVERWMLHALLKVSHLRYYPKFKREMREIITELAEFTGLPKSQVKSYVEQSRQLAEEEWMKRNPKTPEEVLNFYSDSQFYIFDLAHAYSLDAIIVRNRYASLCEGRVLDYGGGSGDIIIRASEYSKDLTYYDVAGRILEFARWRFKKRGLAVKIIEASDKEDRLIGKYDTIFCFSVLEHLYDPLMHLERLRRHISSSGKLFITAQFSTENHPMHMVQNKSLEEMLVSLGFAKVKNHLKQLSYYQLK